MGGERKNGDDLCATIPDCKIALCGDPDTSLIPSSVKTAEDKPWKAVKGKY